METLCQRTPLYGFCLYSFILVFHYCSTRTGEEMSPPAEPHTGGRHCYDAVLPSAPKLLSPPQCHAALDTIPHTLALLDQIPLRHPKTLPPSLRGHQGLDFGGEWDYLIRGNVLRTAFSMKSWFRGRENSPHRQYVCVCVCLYVWRRLPLSKAVYGTDRSVYIGLNHSNQQVLCVAELTHCSTVHFCERSRIYRVVVSVKSSISFRTGSTDSHHHVDHWKKGGGIIYVASQTSCAGRSLGCKYCLAKRSINNTTLC
jgi:hypothetical protein